MKEGPNWLKGRRLSDEERAALSRMRVSARTLGNVPESEIPLEFTGLWSVVQCLHNMCIYPEREASLRTALSVIGLVRPWLDKAEEDVRVALEEQTLGGGGGDPSDSLWARGTAGASYSCGVSPIAPKVETGD